MRLRTIAAAGALALLSPQAGAQLSLDSDQPIDIQGDLSESFEDVMTLTGNVTVIQGESMLRSDKLVAKITDERNFETIEVTGNVRYWNGKEAIASDTAFYDAGPRTITFTNNVVITQDETVISGGSLVYWLDSGKVRMTSPEGGRVRGIFNTKAGSRPQL